MGPRRGPHNCEECGINRGTKTGLSGDLVCDDCCFKMLQRAKENNEKTVPKSTFSTSVEDNLTEIIQSRNSAVEDNTSSSNNTSVDVKNKVIFNVLLSYTVHSMQSCAFDNIKNVVIRHFTEDEILEAKTNLFANCDNAIIGKPINRRDSNTRSEKVANVDDIIIALTKLDQSNKVPDVAVSAFELHRLPKFKPEEFLPMSIVERLNNLDKKVQYLQETVDVTVCDNIVIRERVENIASNNCINKIPSAKPFSYASCVAKNIPRGNASNDLSTSFNHQDYSSGSGGHSKTSSETYAKKPNKLQEQPNTHKSMSLLPLTFENIDKMDEFMLPKHVEKSMRRRQKKMNAPVVKGKAVAESVKGAPEPKRDLFIYRVDKDTETNSLHDYIAGHGIKVIQLDCVSKPISKFKSFKLTVGLSQFSKLFDDSLWPEGVCVRRFFNNKKNEHE